jgi:hypothetical protein
MTSSPTPTLNRARDSLLVPSRTVALLGVAGAVAAVLADAVDDGFWARHTLITSLVVSLLIIAVSVGVINEIIDRRDRRRWSALAQTVVFELVRSSRLTWTVLVDLLGLFPPSRPGSTHQQQLGAARALTADVPRVRAAIAAALEHPERRRHLAGTLTRLSAASREAISAWAPLMIGSPTYAELFDRHVELHTRIEWVSTLMLHYGNHEHDPHRRQLTRASIAVEVQEHPDDLWLRDFVHALIRLAEGLDREATALAIALLPPQRWAAQTRVLLGH